MARAQERCGAEIALPCPCCRYVVPKGRQAGRAWGAERGPVGTGQGGPALPLPLQAILKRGLQPSCTIIPLMKKDHRDNLEFFLSNVGQLYLTGCGRFPCSTWRPLSSQATGRP